MAKRKTPTTTLTTYRLRKLASALRSGHAQIHGIVRSDRHHGASCWIVYDLTRGPSSVGDYPCYHVPVSLRPRWVRHNKGNNPVLDGSNAE